MKINKEYKSKFIKILSYAKSNIHHPDDFRYYIGSQVDTFAKPRTSKQIRENAENQARNFEDYEDFIAHIDTLITVISSLPTE